MSWLDSAPGQLPDSGNRAHGLHHLLPPVPSPCRPPHSLDSPMDQLRDSRGQAAAAAGSTIRQQPSLCLQPSTAGADACRELRVCHAQPPPLHSSLPTNPWSLWSQMGVCTCLSLPCYGAGSPPCTQFPAHKCNICNMMHRSCRTDKCCSHGITWDANANKNEGKTEH